MLQSISIKNLAIVNELMLDFADGMTALTGETGAGKSILIDALGLTLGDKATREMIRAGAEKAEITAIFDVSALKDVRDWLKQQDLLDDNDCILRRVITKEGKSKAFINGSPAPLKSLSAIGSMLIEIHGQHAHQRLLDKKFQLQILDAYANHETLIKQTSNTYQVWQNTLKQFNQLKEQETDRVSRLELLRFQAEELNALDLKAGEISELEEKLKTLSNAEELMRGSYEIASALYENEDALHNRLSALQSHLQKLSALDKSMQNPLEMLETALINIQEASDSLRHFADSFEADEQSLQQVESRLQSIFEIARKYRLEPEALPDKNSQIQTELQSLESADETLAGLADQLTIQQQDYVNAANQLSASRKKAANSLVAETVMLLKSLSMPHVSFEIAFDTSDMNKASRSGLDKIEFLVSANPGQPPASMAKVASGGELSRISLAIQVSTMSNLAVPTLIFDEVDVGIGGGTAEVVGRLLRKLGDQQQALCVTHLPQVASQAHHHYKVEKIQTSDSTSTSISALSAEQRIAEIARMLGGLEVTEQTIAHAKEMISRSAV